MGLQPWVSLEGCQHFLIRRQFILLLTARELKRREVEEEREERVKEGRWEEGGRVRWKEERE